MDSLDSLIRTVAGEASGDPREQQAVAAAIINRARVQGKTIDQVVKAPGQFESWENPQARARILALTPDSPQYQAIRNAVEPVYSGKVADPTNGATHFYAPGAQAALGRNAPKWDDGSGANIGKSRFFNKGAPTALDTFDNLSDLSGNAPASQAGQATTAKGFDFESLADLSPTPATSPAQANPQVADVKPDLTTGIQPYLAKGDETGAMNFLSENGKLPKDPGAIRAAIAKYKQYGPGGVPIVELQPKPPVSTSTGTNLLAGGDMGVQDVLEGGAGKLGQYVEGKLPALRTADQFVGNLLGTKTADQLAADYAQHKQLFDATAGTTGAGQIGRIGGNILATAPLMAVGGGLVGAGGRLAAATAPEVAAPLEFLAGNAGRAVAANEATGAAAVPGNALVRLASRGVNGAIQGGSAATLTSAQSDAPLSDQIKSGAELGGFLGPVGGIAGDAVGSVVNNVAPKLDAATAKLADLAMNKYGIDLRGSQVTPNLLVRRWDQQHGNNNLLSDFGQQNATQRAQFTRAVGNTFGADADNLTPQVMTAAKNKIGKVYDDVAGRTTLDLNPHVDPQTGETVRDFLTDITRAHDAANFGPQNAGRAQKLMDEVLAKVGPDGTMSGSDFKTLTSRGSMLDSATNNPDSEYRAFAKTLRNGLNTELEAAASPGDAEALSKANWQWKNMKTVEKLVANSKDGQIDWGSLQRPVTASFKNRAYTGAGDLGELGDIGRSFMPPSSSGTVENAKAQKLFDMTHALIGTGIAGTLHGLGAPVEFAPLALAAGGAAGVGRAAGNALAARTFGTGEYANKLLARSLQASPNSIPENALNAAAMLAKNGGLITGANQLQRRLAAH